MKDFTTIWKQLAKEKKLSSHHFIQLAVLKAMKSKNEDKQTIIHSLLEKYFTKTTNANKIANGTRKENGVYLALYWARHYSRVWYNQLQNDHYPNIVFDREYQEVFDDYDELKQYQKLIQSIDITLLRRMYVYYFTRQDIPPVHQAVQAAHVLYKLGSKMHQWANPDETHFQWIGVKDATELTRVIKTIPLVWEDFCEPDLGGIRTAVAFYPVPWNKRGKLVDYPLLNLA